MKSFNRKLVLEDGSEYCGYGFGSPCQRVCELVFNTSMVGYQEIVSDPSYAGQIVTLTYPQIGNYGINEKDMQGDPLHLAGLVVHDMCYTPSNWQSVESFPNFLAQNGVVAIEDVDTRALTIAIREGGAMRAAISTTDLDPESLIARVKASPSIADHNYVADVSTKESYVVPGQDADGQPRLHVVAYDCGEKRGNRPSAISAAGCEVTVVPWDTPAEKVLEMNPRRCVLLQRPRRPRLRAARCRRRARVPRPSSPSSVSASATRSSPWRPAPRSRSSRTATTAATSL